MSNRRLPGVKVLRLDYEAGAGSQTVWFGRAAVVVKHDDPSQPHPTLVANELIATRLAMAAGIPVPMGEAAELPDKRRAWVSAQIELEGQALPPADPSEIALVRPSEAAAITAFDVWVHNEDRHEENLLFHPKVGLWAFDFEKSLGGEDSGDPDFLARHRLDPTRLWAFDPGELDRQMVMEWADRLWSVPRSCLEAATHEARARNLLTAGQVSGLIEFLSVRQQKIRWLVRQSLGWNDSSGQAQGGSS